MSKVAVVTGGSSGIGLCTAQSLRDAGCTVFEFSRRESAHKGISHITADVTDPASVDTAVGEVIRRTGQIDILICNAGTGISGAVEFTDPEAARHLMDVNFWGMVHTVQAVLPHMRTAGRGRIICTSSIAGPLPIPFQTYYSVTKAAINAFVLGLANELRPYGVSICAVMPGDICTGFTAAREKNCAGDDVYSGRIERSVSRMEKDEQNGMDPAVAGRVLCRKALKRRVKPLYAIGFVYKLFTVLQRILPVSLVNFIVYMMYAR